MNGKLFGMNLATGTFGESNDSGTLPGTLGTTYEYPSNPLEYQYYAKKGLTLFRLGVMWERLQNQALGPLSAPDIEGVQAMLNQVQAVNGKAIIDIHNYTRYYNVPLVAGDQTLANLWNQLAKIFVGNSTIYGYELNNEPNNLVGGGETWASIAQTVINAIREVDKTTTIIVNGYNWQHPDGWATQNPTLHTLTDPSNRIIFSSHCYFDGDESGGYWTGAPNANNNNGTLLLTGSGNFVDWLQQYGFQGILTEYGVPYGPGATTPLNTQWFPVLKDFLNTINTTDVLLGGTAWAAGEWWGNYNLTVEPSDAPTTFNDDRPSMAIYAQFPSTPIATTPATTTITANSSPTTPVTPPVTTPSTPTTVPTPTPTQTPTTPTTTPSTTTTEPTIDITTTNEILTDTYAITQAIRKLFNI